MLAEKLMEDDAENIVRAVIAAAKGGDPRLSCIIDYNAQRVASLKARYP